MKIAVLEDDDAQAELLLQWLEDAGHQVKRASECRQFLQDFSAYLPDLAVLDWQLPDGSGVDVLTHLRAKLASKIPVLFTTQRGAEADIVAALQAGADDYLVKPLRHREFSARLHALGRRAGIQDHAEIIIVGPFTIDRRREVILLDGEPVKLTQKDYSVALCLFQNMGKALSREYLLKTVWGVEAGLDTRTVDVHVSRVRWALKIGPENGFIIKTIYQHGYRLEWLAGGDESRPDSSRDLPAD